MSILARIPHASDSGGQGPVVRRIAETERRAALGLLMTGKADPAEPAVRQFLAFAEEHRLDTDAFFGVFDGQVPLACALAVPGAGRTAMLFTNPLRRGDDGLTLSAAARAAIGGIDPKAVRLIQSLTDLNQRAERVALAAAGLTPLAELVYMQRYVDRQAIDQALTDPVSGRPLVVRHWSQGARPAFEQAILSSYEGTLDCPGLLGLRQIEDIVAGHMATGRFDPGLWSVFEAEGQPVAVLLLAHVPARQAFELVYLGVGPSRRGMGLGAVLLRHGLAAVASRGGGRLHLAVDAANKPAVRLYQRHGFRPNAHKAAMIGALE